MEIGILISGALLLVGTINATMQYLLLRLQRTPAPSNQPKQGKSYPNSPLPPTDAYHRVNLEFAQSSFRVARFTALAAVATLLLLPIIAIFGVLQDQKINPVTVVTLTAVVATAGLLTAIWVKFNSTAIRQINEHLELRPEDRTWQQNFVLIQKISDESKRDAEIARQLESSCRKCRPVIDISHIR